MSIRLVALSDTHGNLERIQIPDGDILLHAGDFCFHVGTPQELEKEFKALSKFPHKHKCVIAGNHDFPCQDIPQFAEQIAFENGLNYLEDSGCVIEGLNIYGSPWTPWFLDWAFNFQNGDLDQERRYFNAIPDDTNVLITHGPPRNMLDRTPDHYERMGRNVGSGPLLHRVLDLPELYLHVFGHIHASRGAYNATSRKTSTMFCNASVCTERYKPINKPYVIDFDSETKKITVVSE